MAEQIFEQKKKKGDIGLQGTRRNPRLRVEDHTDDSKKKKKDCCKWNKLNKIGAWYHYIFVIRLNRIYRQKYVSVIKKSFVSHTISVL